MKYHCLHDSSKLPDNPRIMVVGNNKMEDERLIIVRQLITQISRNNNSIISIISPSEKTKNFYQTYFPDATIKYKMDPEYLEKCIQRATEINTNTSHIIVLDDCINITDISNIFRHIITILMNIKILGMSCIITTSNEMHLTPMIRSYFDMIFLFHQDSINYRMRLWRYYGKNFQTFDDFDVFFRNKNNRFSIMVIDMLNNNTFNLKIEKGDLEQIFESKQDKISNDIFDEEDEYSSSEESEASTSSVRYIKKDKIDNINNDPCHGCLKMEYSDDNYQMSLKLTNPNNYHIIELLCNHIASIKNIKTEQMKLINENIKLQLQNKKNIINDDSDKVDYETAK